MLRYVRYIGQMRRPTGPTGAQIRMQRPRSGDGDERNKGQGHPEARETRKAKLCLNALFAIETKRPRPGGNPVEAFSNPNPAEERTTP